MTVFRSVDLSKFIGKPFCWRTYNCWHFVVDFYKAAGIELQDYTPKDLTLSASAELFKNDVHYKGFIQIEKPDYGDVVLMNSPRNGLFHVGVWVGKVIHCSSKFQGGGQVMCEELYFIKKQFKNVTFWRWQL